MVRDHAGGDAGAALSGDRRRVMMQRWVVDKNMLSSTELADYLKLPYFQVVLSDTVGIESYRARSIEDLRSDFSVVRMAPQKVVILKDGFSCFRLSGRDAGLRKRMIDVSTTHDFPKFCHALFASDKGAEALLTRRRIAAGEQLQSIQEFAAQLPAIVSDLSANYFTPADLRILRKKERMDDKLVAKLLQVCQSVATTAMKRNGVRIPRNQVEWINSFGFRLVVALFINILNWVRNGRSTEDGKHNVEESRNDYVDCMVAVYATYFDGLLSNDKGTRRTYAELSAIINLYKSVPKSSPKS